MISDQTLFIIYVLLILGAGVFVFAFFYATKSRGKRELSGSFNLKLFQVILPRHVAKERPSLEQVREKIAIMEKLYANMKEAVPSGWIGGMRTTFALELTVTHIGEEITFYVAVPKMLAGSVAKIIEGVYPDAQVVAIKDYNIFNPEGEAAGAYLTLDKNDFLPIRTYKALEADPLSELSNTFSKLAPEGEGAALQLIIRPASNIVSKSVLSFAKKIFEEGSFKKRGILATIMDDISGKKPGAKKEGEKPKTLTPKEEEMLRAIENKGAKPLFDANIRIIASASSQIRAKEILKNIEAAFAQFENPTLNKFKITELSGSALRNLFYQYSFRLFDKSQRNILSSEELTSVFHLPNTPLETPKIKAVKSKEASPPPNLPSTGLVLGYNIFRGQEYPIRMLREDRLRHLYIIGQTGTGKTSFMENLIRQDIESGNGVCFIDPHGDAIEQRILGFVPESRKGDVIYFNPADTAYPLGLNMLDYDHRYPEQKTFIVNELLDIFNKLYNMSVAGGPMFEQYFRNAALLVMDDPESGSTLLEIERVLTEKNFRDYKLSRSNNIVVKKFWTEVAEKAGGDASLQNMVPYITSKFDTFLANEIMRPIIAQEHSAFNFREAMDEGKILLINLSKGRLGELNSSLIGLIMVGKLLMAAFSRTDIQEGQRKDFHVYIDEFQNATTKSIATILSEARKYRLSLTIAHQFIGQLEEEIKKAVFGNVGSHVAFRVGQEDAEFLAKQFAPEFGPEDLVNIDNYNAVIKLLIGGQTSKPFNVHSYPPAEPHPENILRIKELSRAVYGRPREEIEQEISARYFKKETPK